MLFQKCRAEGSSSSPFTSLYTTGVMMDCLLLDPPRRLLSVFIWIENKTSVECGTTR
ncbi:hypothetical protein V8B97DRAFT_1954291 [Scleroderma yunnanense]